jgi:hypothetical protein
VEHVIVIHGYHVDKGKIIITVYHVDKRKLFVVVIGVFDVEPSDSLFSVSLLPLVFFGAFAGVVPVTVSVETFDARRVLVTLLNVCK